MADYHHRKTHVNPQWPLTILARARVKRVSEPKKKRVRPRFKAERLNTSTQRQPGLQAVLLLELRLKPDGLLASE